MAILIICSLAFSSVSCASTGPKITKEDRKRAEEAFNTKFLQASGGWLERVYRVGYRLLTARVPNHAGKDPKYGFVGVGVDELKDASREVYGIDREVRGVLVRGLYPDSKAERLDLRAGDVIVKLDGKKVKNLGKYFKIMRSAHADELKAEIWRGAVYSSTGRRGGEIVERTLPVERVFYNAQFFLAPTPDVDASAAYSKIEVGVGAIRYCQNDDELAVIMGHELAHTTLKHVIKRRA